jgi:hypothetical protein
VQAETPTLQRYVLFIDSQTDLDKAERVIEATQRGEFVLLIDGPANASNGIASASEHGLETLLNEAERLRTKVNMKLDALRGDGGVPDVARMQQASPPVAAARKKRVSVQRATEAATRGLEAAAPDHDPPTSPSAPVDTPGTRVWHVQLVVCGPGLGRDGDVSSCSPCHECP